MGSKYEKEDLRVKQNETELELRQDEERDSRLAQILKDIANQVMEDIEMEADFPSNNLDGKMAVLDTKVWTCKEEGYILYQHYEKPMASKEVLHAQSAQSMTCKRSVHVQEILRRILNTSSRLDWLSYGVPCLTENEMGWI